MICYEDKTWCDAKRCKNYGNCEKSLLYAMRKQAAECPDVRDRIPYAVRDMSDDCNDYEVAE